MSMYTYLWVFFSVASCRGGLICPSTAFLVSTFLCFYLCFLLSYYMLSMYSPIGLGLGLCVCYKPFDCTYSKVVFYFVFIAFKIGINLINKNKDSSLAAPSVRPRGLVKSTTFTYILYTFFKNYRSLKTITINLKRIIWKYFTHNANQLTIPKKEELKSLILSEKSWNHS